MTKSHCFHFACQTVKNSGRTITVKETFCSICVNSYFRVWLCSLTSPDVESLQQGQHTSVTFHIPTW